MTDKLKKYSADKEKICRKNDDIAMRLYDEYGVKKGLRDENGSGVLAGLTNISKVTSSKIVNGKKRRATAAFGIADTA